MSGIFLFALSCSKDENPESLTPALGSDIHLNGGNTKVDICHNDHIINVSINAVDAHKGHGDAIDMDGDGYFDIDNSCSETDCDDTYPAINPGTLENCEDGGDGSVAELLIGTWETSDIALSANVGGQTVIDYLVDVVGLSAADAAARNDIFIAEMEAELTVTLILNADHTYESVFAGGMDSGIWDLSPDETTLTLFEGGDTIVVSLAFVTETTLGGTLGDTILFDLDGVAGTPDEEVVVMATVIMTRS
jgi:hypothetical protein